MRGKKGGNIPPDDSGAKKLHLGVIKLEWFAGRQKRLEKKLQSSKNFMEIIFDSVNDAISIIDTANFRIVKANRYFLNIFKREEKEVVGKYYYEAIYRQDTLCEPPDSCPLVETLKTGRHTSAEQVCYDKDGREIHMEVSISPLRNEKGEMDQVVCVVRDITKRWQMEEKLRLHFVNLAETVSHIFSLKDPYVRVHEQGAARLARIVGAEFGLDKQRLQGLYVGSLLHDIGKVAIPEAILVKPGLLTPEEWAIVRTYPQRGYEILQGAGLPWPVAEMALHHQERLDGSGYPDRLKGDQLCREVRIIAACSVMSAMAIRCPYRPARCQEEIIKEMAGDQGRKYDARVVDILLDMLTGAKLGFLKNGIAGIRDKKPLN